jgi:heme iron utilization protein
MAERSAIAGGGGPPHRAAADAARLVLAARSAALATLDAQTGHPYASLVTVAVDTGGAPLMLLSGLARHTRNLDHDPRASLLFEPAALSPGDPLASARVTLVGAAQPTTNPQARARFLARHPEAAMYADFADFRFFVFTAGHAHFIGGFGRIVEIPAAELLAAAGRPDRGHGA